METTVLVAIISAAAGIFASALTFFLTKRKEREAEWRKQKLESYKELISALSGLAAADPPSDARVRFAHIANHILLVATPSVLVALRDFLDETADSNANKTIDRHDELLTVLMYAIREDLGIKPNKAATQFHFRLWAAGTSKAQQPRSEEGESAKPCYLVRSHAHMRSLREKMTVLETSWLRAWADLSLPPPPSLHEQLIAAYQEPHRHYHSLQHLSECLAHFATVRDQAQHPGEVALALWFHDAVYDVKGSSNECLSADWAVRVLQAAGADLAVQGRVERLIMATQHGAAEPAADEPDQQLLVDIDLAILGAAPERFAEYDRQVRAEYRWVPGIIYRMKRKAVLQSFLARPYIYGTAHFRERYEAQARRNLALAVA